MESRKIHRPLLLLVIAGALLVPGNVVRAEPIEALHQKLSLETQLETRIQQTLVPFVGTQDIIAVVKLTMAREGGTKEETLSKERAVRRWDEREETVLPGVPAANPMTKKTSIEELKKSLYLLNVSNISVSLYVAKPMNDEKKKKIGQLIIDILGLNIEGGDAVTIETYSPLAASRFVRSISLGEIIAALALMVFIILIFGPLKSFLRALSGSGAHAAGAGTQGTVPENTRNREENDEEIRESHSRGTVPDLPPVSHNALSLTGFVNENNVEDLKRALADETPHAIAIAVQHIPSQWALSVIPAEKRHEVIAAFVNTVIEDPKEVKAILERIREKVEGSHGGAAKLCALLQSADKSTQESILSQLREQSPVFSQEVESGLFRFDDLLRYDDQSLRRIFRKAGTESFAKCLKTCPEDSAKALYDKLGPAITNLLASRIKTTMLADGDEVRAQMELIRAIEYLSKRGFVPPLSKIKQPVKE